jgi:lipoprotein-anchoring transpeptidase ErfK/SrfK
MTKKSANNSSKNILRKSFLPIIFLFCIFAYGFISLLSSDKKVSPNELQTDAYVRFVKSQNGQWNNTTSQPIFQNKPVGQPVKLTMESQSVLSATVPDEEKWIEVKLSEPQTLYAHEGDKIVFTFLISGGKWGRTPRGEFRIWGKYRYSTMIGGSMENGDYYNLPNVPYTMYFSGGVGLHGAYWHNNFGKPMSHGCVNIAIPDAEKLFNWANPIMPAGEFSVMSSGQNPGTRVVVHD